MPYQVIKEGAEQLRPTLDERNQLSLKNPMLHAMVLIARGQFHIFYKS